MRLFLAFFLLLSSFKVSATCEANVKVLGTSTYDDDKEINTWYTVVYAKITDVLNYENCKDKKIGDDVYYLHPGGVKGNFSQIVAGSSANETIGNEYKVSLSDTITKLGASLLLSSDQTANSPNYAFSCLHSGVSKNSFMNPGMVYLDYDQGPSVFWKDRNVVFHPGVSFDSNVSDGFLKEVLMQAAQAWNNADCTDLKIIVGDKIDLNDTDSFDPNTQSPKEARNLVVVRKGTKGIIGSAWAGAQEVIASTYITSWIPTGQIYEISIRFNGEDYDFTDCVTHKCQKGSVFRNMDMVTVTTHEMGHALGLGHSDVKNDRSRPTIMFPYIGSGEVKRTLTEDDKKGICYLYPKNQKSPNCYDSYPRGKNPPTGWLSLTLFDIYTIGSVIFLSVALLALFMLLKKARL